MAVTFTTVELRREAIVGRAVDEDAVVLETKKHKDRLSALRELRKLAIKAGLITVRRLK